MKSSERYETSRLIEGQFEPGSRGRVLCNMRGINKKREMDSVEGHELARALRKFIGAYDQDHQFTADDICAMHREWLGGIYEWAGKYRQVNLAKGNMFFAASRVVPFLMVGFEMNFLALYTPCRFSGYDTIRALAAVHVELLLIHPFREGNGRLARVLASLMALQADLPLLDFSILTGAKKEKYFEAGRSGFGSDYSPMEKIFDDVIEKTLASPA